MAGDDQERPAAREGPRPIGQLAPDSAAFTRLISAYYRGEVDRTTAWRKRLDQTTNWAVVLVAAILTWAFSSGDNPHYVVLIGVFGVAAFLLMETHRYREYDVWRRRVRTLQRGLIADTLDPTETDQTAWRTQLSSELRTPVIGLSFYQAFTHRLRRSYLGLLLILFVAWLSRILLFEPTEPWRRTAAIMGIPGEAVVVTVGLFYLVIIGLAALSALGTRVREFQQ